jgi:hypothetical protein
LLQQELIKNHLEPGFDAGRHAKEDEVPSTPAPSAQEILGPDIAKTR